MIRFFYTIPSFLISAVAVVFFFVTLAVAFVTEARQIKSEMKTV